MARIRLGYLMDGDEPAGGRWNFDADNRQPLPAGDPDWPEPLVDGLDEIDRQVLADFERLDLDLWGAAPSGRWATTRRGALRRLRHVVDQVLPRFGPHEDAMSATSWHLAHTMLSPYLNLGMLHPGEVADAVEAATAGAACRSRRPRG